VVLPTLGAALKERERSLIEQALTLTQGNVTAACRLIHTPREHFYAKMRRLGIDYKSFRVPPQAVVREPEMSER
jgi:DNA-binding NtrC family response regulator